MTDCIFCGIAAGAEPAEIVHEDDTTVAFMDIRPITPGHTLVIPRRHAADVWELPDDDAGPLMRAVSTVAHMIRDTLAPDGLNLFQANGTAAFQTVFHFHMHVLPRTHGDFDLPAGILQASPWSREDLATMAARIRG
jgi:histidine triad (HIT) family protein